MDRRRVLAGDPARLTRGLSSGAAVGAILLVCLLIGRSGADNAGLMAIMSHAVVATGAAAAAVLLLHWRLGRDAPAALLALALLLLVVASTLVRLGEFIAATPAGQSAFYGVRLLAVVGAVVLALRAGRHVDVDTRLRPSVVAAAVGLLLVLAFLVGIWIGAPLAPLQLIGRITLAGGMCVAAVLLRRRFTDPASDPHRWAASAAVLVVIAQLSFAASISGQHAWEVAALTAYLAATAMALIGSSDDLARMFAGHRDRVYDTLVDHRAHEARSGAEQVLDQRRRHDLLSAITAVDGASTTLERYGDRLLETDRETLKTLTRHQLGNLTALIQSPREPHRSAPFDLLDTLQPVWHTAGRLAVTPPTPVDCGVLGRPRHTVAVVSTILRMCEEDPAVRSVAVDVAVDPPGADDRRRAHLAMRPALVGCEALTRVAALDVAVLARLMQEQGGTLNVDRRPLLFQISLPLAEHPGALRH